MPDISLGNWFAARSQRSPHRRALSFEGTTWTFAQMQDRIDRLAVAFRTGGVCRGDRVGFLGLNQPAFFLTMFAASRLGAIFVPLNFRLTGPELSFIINDAGIHSLVIDELHQPVIDGIRAELPCHRYLAAEALPEAEPLVAPEPMAEDEVALIMYTSGTTGRPKGAMLTHGNLWWNNANQMHFLDVLEDDVTLVVAPLFHIGGLNVTTLITWQRGGEVVLHRTFDPGTALEDIARYGVTTMFGVPAIFLFMSQDPGFTSADLTSIRTLICGGAPVPEPLMKLYLGRGISMNQGYGLTETSPSLTFLTSEFGLAKLGSAGLAPLLTELRLVDADGHVITEPMVRGEICARGPNIMKGYWNRPDATAAAIDLEGWFHTGDIAYVDDGGFYYLCDRVKDMVITGGENVYPAEVESVLYDHPAVAEVAIIGVPDERWGEAVVAVAALKADTGLSLDQLRDFAADRLARYKLPSRLELVDALPRNPAGKVLKYELRERYRA